MMIFMQSATASFFLLSLLILGSPNAAFGRLRGGIKGDDLPRGVIHNKQPRHLETTETSTTSSDGYNVDIIPDVDIASGIVTGVTDRTKGVKFDAGFSPSNPVVFTNMMTYNGIDPSYTRTYDATASGFNVMVQEETKNDLETRHWKEENVGYMAFDLPGRGVGSFEDENSMAIGRIGRFSMTFSTRKDTSAYMKWIDSDIVAGSEFVAITTTNSYGAGEDPIQVRVKKVYSAQGNVMVEFKIEGMDPTDGETVRLDLIYMIVKVGIHTLKNGKIIEAIIDTAVDDNFKKIPFGVEYDDKPVVLSQSQTNHETDPIVTRMEEVNDSGVMVKVQEEEGIDTSHMPESVGLIVYGSPN